MAVLGLALGLRLWGLRHGLPYVYNTDENAHFVPNAIGLFGHGWNTHYFVNPPAFTYLLHAVFAVWFGGRDGVDHAYATDPAAVLVVARATSALLGTAAVGLLYLAGARLAGRGVGLLAAALLAVAFLPVFYGHLALNDGAALAPVALSLWGAARVARDGRGRDFALAGAGLGLACATKYTALVALLPLVGAALVAPRPRADVGRGLLVAGLAALAAFVAADPYAVLAPRELHGGLAHQLSATGDAAGKLGLTQPSGHLYYLWTLTWGLGWLPLAAALAALPLLWLRDRRLLAMLGPAVVLFVLVMGLQGRFYGRWLLPVYPVACVLAAVAAVALAERLPRWAGPVLAALLLGQGLLASVHGDRVLSRPDTRNLARAWLAAHVPAGTRVVVEPINPDAWASDVGHALATANGARFRKWRSLRDVRDGRVVNIEDYERTLFPGLLDRYRRAGFCWVVSGSTQRGRAEADPAAVPLANAYYRRLERDATVERRFSPYRVGAGPVAFNFDWSFDPYPPAYRRPGPDVRIFHLRGRGCEPAP
ncbi:MAG TPA: glycosyltransferase family 39 protein [Solirubrobacteraceae bacterium]|nr:glycosyltransferase family 39 protein [Solirubrobacteraceae bacterium]